MNALPRRRAHQRDGTLVGGHVALRRDAGPLIDKVLPQVLEQIVAGIEALVVHAGIWRQVRHLQALHVIVVPRQIVIDFADDQRGVFLPQEPALVRSRQDRFGRRDADEVGQGRRRGADLLGHDGAERRILDRAAERVAGMQDVGAEVVIVGLARVHRADDGHLVHVPGDLGQVLADLDAGRRRVDFLEETAVGVTGLERPGVGMARAAGHPQQDAGLAPLRIAGRVVRQGLHPPGHGVADHAGRGQTQPVAAGEVIAG